jgi:hypothetical protein
MNRLPASAHNAESFEPRSETETRLHGYRLVLVRLLCLTLGVLSVETSPRPASHIPFLSIGLKTSPTLSGQPKPGKMLIRRNLVK